jgi:hypothetical protein
MTHEATAKINRMMWESDGFSPWKLSADKSSPCMIDLLSVISQTSRLASYL